MDTSVLLLVLGYIFITALSIFYVLKHEKGKNKKYWIIGFIFIPIILSLIYMSRTKTPDKA